MGFFWRVDERGLVYLVERQELFRCELDRWGWAVDELGDPADGLYGDDDGGDGTGHDNIDNDDD